MQGRGVILGESPQTGPLQILVPRGYEDVEVIGRCLVPGCGAEFRAGQEEVWQRHVGKCARANLDKLRAAAAVPRMVAEDYDPEVTKHLRGVGKRMLEEGRLTVKPHETAGWS